MEILSAVAFSLLCSAQHAVSEHEQRGMILLARLDLLDPIIPFVGAAGYPALPGLGRLTYSTVGLQGMGSRACWSGRGRSIASESVAVPKSKTDGVSTAPDEDILVFQSYPPDRGQRAHCRCFSS